MRTRRIHIMGAPGSGTTTLGRHLSMATVLPHHDTDDFFWLPSNPPFRQTRPREERLALMRTLFLEREGWILSGSLEGWGDEFISSLDYVIFISLEKEIRMKRLRAREERHYGAAAVAPGGWRYEETQSFLDWAAHYDDSILDGRNRKRHEAWLSRLSCPILQADGGDSIESLVGQAVGFIGKEA
jgi:adenylate kinase family enzyme